MRFTVTFDPLGFAKYDNGILLKKHPEAIKKDFALFEYNLEPTTGDDVEDFVVLNARDVFEQGEDRSAVVNNADYGKTALEIELSVLRKTAKKNRVGRWKQAGKLAPDNVLGQFSNAAGLCCHTTLV